MIHDSRPYLHDILDSIARLQRYAKGLYATEFLKNELLQDAIVRRLEIIGEAVGRLPDDLKNRHPDIPWRDIKDMRNKLIHDYGHVWLPDGVVVRQNNERHGDQDVFHIPRFAGDGFNRGEDRHPFGVVEVPEFERVGQANKVRKVLLSDVAFGESRSPV